MTRKNQSFKELINGKKLSFLVGAGCSVDTPSCLPTGRAMIEAIINVTCAESEIEKLLDLKELRFEQLVEIIRDRLDPELKIIDYYGMCDTPNLQHYFLAEMLQKGHFVMTTNFDFLIEHALEQSGVPKNEIVPVITRNDFETYNNPEALFQEGKKVVYKIHGSPKNIITQESTKDSLVATIQAFGLGKEGESVFQLEPFKRPLFNNISRGRTLVVMGYSGSDDFDIVPTLQVLKDVETIVWIDYKLDDGGREQIYEIDGKTILHLDQSDKVNQILSGIYRMRNTRYIYRVETNTLRLVNDLLETKPSLNAKNFSLKSTTFLKDNIKAADSFQKFSIPYKIYDNFNKHPDSMRCLTTILKLAEEQEDLSWKAFALSSMGTIYGSQGNYTEALKYYEEALKIDKQLSDLSEKATHFNNIGSIYYAQGNYPEAINRYEEALKIIEQFGDLSKKARVLNNIGKIYYSQGNYPEAINRYEEALKIDEQLGDLSGKATDLINIGSVYYAQGNYPEALERYEEALKIDEQLGDLSGKATDLNNIGEIYRAQGNYPEALERYEEALKIDYQLGDLSGKATRHNNIGSVYYAQGNYPEALERYEEALKIDEQLGDLSGKATRLNNIGKIYYAQGNYSEAINWYEEALKIADQLGDLSKKATRLNNIGSIYQVQGNYSEALIYYEEALKIADQLGDLSGKATRLNNIGGIYQAQGNYPEALERYEEALKIAEQLGDLLGKATRLNNIGSIYYAQGNYEASLRSFEQALDTLIELGLENSRNAQIFKKNIEALKNILNE